MRILKQVVLLLLCMVTNSVFADGYYGINYSRVELNGAEPQAVDVKWGAQLSELMGVEVRTGQTVVSDSAEIFTVPVEFETSYTGVLSRVGAFRERGGLYGIVGFMSVTVEVETSQASAKETETDMVLGIGAEFGTEYGFTAEYILGTRDLESVSWLTMGYFRRY